jgi:hypothetical protein
MKKLFLILFTIVFSTYVKAQTGIGTTAPINKFEVVTASADPANTGATANGNLRLGPSTGSHVLDFGLSSSSTYAWLQARSKSAYGTTYNLALNPTGGNVGIGTTTPAAKLHVKSNGPILRLEGSDHAYLEWFPLGSSTRYGYMGFPNAAAAPTQLTFMNQFPTGSIAFGTNEEKRMTITSTGQVGIGNEYPGATLEIGSSSGSVAGNLILNPTTSGTGAEGAEINLRPAPVTTSPAAQTWVIDQASNANSPRLRFFPNISGESYGFTIRDNGYLGIGTGTPSNKLHVQSNDETSVYIESTTSNNSGMLILNANTNQNWSNNLHEFVYFKNQGTNIGGIYGTNGGNMIMYGTTSDYRLKTDLRNYNGLDLVNKIKTYDYAWKKDSSRMYGVMAHELQSVLPYAATGQKDAVDADGKIIPQAVDYSKLTPILIKAIQEQDIKIKEQEGKILKLNNQKDSIEKRVSDLESLIKKLIKKNN